METLIIMVKDSDNCTYTREYSPSADKLDAIRWTITCPDIYYFLDVGKITEINVKMGVTK